MASQAECQNETDNVDNFLCVKKESGSKSDTVQCPICFTPILRALIERHADTCADSTSHETLEILSSQEDARSDEGKHTKNFYDPEIFDSDSEVDSQTRNVLPPKQSAWDLENSFDKEAPSLKSNPNKRKNIIITSPSSSSEKNTNKAKHKKISLAPYPDLQESKARGCLKNVGNNPGSAVQSFLKRPFSPVARTSHGDIFGDVSNGELKASTVQGPSASFGFKIHPFLSKASSVKLNPDSGDLAGAIVPDGEGGFIIDDSVLDDDNASDDNFSLPPLRSTGFIDFQNQFKESSKPSAKRKTKAKSPSRSPRKKKKWKTWGAGGRGKWSRGRGRGGGRGAGARGRRT